MAGEYVEEHFEHPLVPGGQFVVLRGEMGRDVLFDVAWSGTPGYAGFLEDFEVLKEDYLGEPGDAFYQVIQFTRLIRRRSDGRLFGAGYYESPGNDSMESGNEGMSPYEELGLSWDWESEEPEPVVFLPVTRFERVGYEVDKLLSWD